MNDLQERFEKMLDSKSEVDMPSREDGANTKSNPSEAKQKDKTFVMILVILFIVLLLKYNDIIAFLTGSSHPKREELNLEDDNDGSEDEEVLEYDRGSDSARQNRVQEITRKETQEEEIHEPKHHDKKNKDPLFQEFV